MPQSVRVAKFVAIVGATLLVLTGCSLIAHVKDSINDNTADRPIAEMRVPMTSSLRTLYDQKIHWESCGKPYECGYVYVPLNWRKPAGTRIHLAVIKHPASGQKLGSLLVNPGGPGESGFELVNYGVENAVDSAVAKRYDVIGFDPPGVGYSSAVRCGTAKDLDAYLYGTVPGTIGSSQWIAATKAKSVAFAAACKKDTGALLGHVDTISAAHDMDLLRAVLGEEKLDYLGYSYGTYLGTVYAGLYPQNVGRLVFDGPENPWYTGGGSTSSDDSGSSGAELQADGFDGDLDAYLRSCLANEKEAVGSLRCPMHGSFADARAAVEKDLATASKRPILNADGRSLNAATLATAISQAMYDTASWPQLTRMFTEVAAGRSTTAFKLADSYNERKSNGKYEDNADEANLAISCLEDGHSIDLSYDAKELKSLRSSAPILGQYQSYGDLDCAGWPVGPISFPLPIHADGAPPILLVATTGDPATPYSAAKALTKQLSSGRMVTFHGEGHTAYDLGHPCVDKAVDAYLIEGKVPAANLQCG